MFVWSCHKTSFCLFLKFFVLSIFNRFNTAVKNTLTYDSDIVCRKTFLPTYFDKLWFRKFVIIYKSIFLYVYEIELKFLHCVAFLLHRRITSFCALRIGWLTRQIQSIWRKLHSTKTFQKKILELYWTILFNIAIGFLSQFFAILLVILGSFWRIHLSKSCGYSTVWVEILCSAAGIIVPTPRLRINLFLQKMEFSSL